MSERNEKVKKAKRLEIAAQIVAAVASNPNFKGSMEAFSAYISWADRLMKENEKADIQAKEIIGEK